MKTITTKRGKQINLLTPEEWSELMLKHHGPGWGLAALEQSSLQSEHNKVCIDCLTGERLVHITTRALIKSTDYYMCQECLDYYNNK